MLRLITSTKTDLHLDRRNKEQYNKYAYKECVRDKPYDRRQPTERQGANA